MCNNLFKNNKTSYIILLFKYRKIYNSLELKVTWYYFPTIHCLLLNAA